MTPEDRARIAARYPKRPWTDLLIGAGIGVGILAAMGTVLVTGVSQANPPVVAMVRAFDVPSSRQLTAELVVQRREPSDAVECRVYAQAQSYETVAEDIIRIPPGREALTPVNIALNTVKEATSISVDYCRVVG